MSKFNKSGIPPLIISNQDNKTSDKEIGLEFNYRNILDTITEGIYAISKNGRCLYANSACWRTLGYNSDSELLGQNMHNLIHHSHGDLTAYPSDSCKIGKAIKEGIEILPMMRCSGPNPELLFPYVTMPILNMKEGS